jgi:hypothetical protein
VTAVGVRAGAGVAPGGEPVYGAQVELTDRDGGSAVELALLGFAEARTQSRYQITEFDRSFDYREEMSVRGIGLAANLLLRHATERRGPYFIVGLGVGGYWFDWTLVSTDPRAGTPLPTGGSTREERRMILGSLLSAGIGQRLGDRLDVRAQVNAVIVPSTALREELEFIPIVSLSSGLRLRGRAQ